MRIIRSYCMLNLAAFLMNTALKTTLEVIVLNPLSYQPEVSEIVNVNWADRWQVYQRLQELDIPCWCATDCPLRVHIADVTAAVQLWSVLRQLTASRHDLVCQLECCWQYRA